MDTFGAVLGPIVALIYLYYYPEDYINLFYIALIPGILAIAASFILKDKKIAAPNKTKSTNLFSFIKYWNESPLIYRKVVIGLLAFAIINSSDFFLLLKAKQSGLNDTQIIGIYIFYNLVYALFSYPLGSIADKIGLKKMFIFGLILFAFVYFGMAFSNNIYFFMGLFFIYGIYASATEGISKAWISNIVNKKDTATAIGTYAGFQSICALIASSSTGFIWFNFGANAAFIITGIVTILIIIYFLFYLAYDK